jgi:6-pyruvoyl-tetrahydropterin synthase
VHGTTLKPDGTLFDITLLQDALGTVVKQLHYQNLDDIEGLNTRNTTAEVVADYIWHQVAPSLQNVGLIDLRIAVWESPSAWAGVMRELPQ